MKQLLCLLIMVPLLSKTQVLQTINKGQIVDKGIKWTEGLTFEQIKNKAKAENKYIFLDCFTTWCGPCKLMDNQVYGNESVGNYINEHFISVKVQMDTTKKDNYEVKSWYGEAANISKQYRVEGFPTFIFLSPQGFIVHKEMGFKEVKEFIALAQTATQPGKVYDDPYVEYDRLVAEYKQGKKIYDHYPFMIRKAFQAQDDDFGNQLIKELSSYVSDLSPQERYTKERIEMWASFTISSTTRIFRFFYQDGDLIDKVMAQKGYAATVVDKTIQNEIVLPFFAEQNANPSIAMEGMYLTGKGLRSDFKEADWNKLDKVIREKYGTSYAKRNVLEARVEWYNRHRNFPAYTKYALLQLNEYSSKKTESPFKINSIAWAIFLYSTDRKILKGGIKWMKKAIKMKPDRPDLLDTYANLLYKYGRKKDAIRWEEKAVEKSNTERRKTNFLSIVEKMKQGKPTYLEQGAIWGNN